MLRLPERRPLFTYPRAGSLQFHGDEFCRNDEPTCAIYRWHRHGNECCCEGWQDDMESSMYGEDYPRLLKTHFPSPDPGRSCPRCLSRRQAKKPPGASLNSSLSTSATRTPARPTAQAAGAFLRWCEEQGHHAHRGRAAGACGGLYRAVGEMRKAPTVKQHLACIRMLFDWLVTGQVVPSNPAHAVRGPRHSVMQGRNHGDVVGGSDGLSEKHRHFACRGAARPRLYRA